ncbi:AAA-like domain-containing protein [Roseofilum sp. Guam]|uniref:AAA-like domain-containing protein n=1 Tax=Roseofilum sp. Guam TaxID=2821502 RepID=UPI001B0D265F|nr:AAA-like domain-containing protein [Roseofilum sp. Guam]MBP0027104.1 AAA-like domain-containing protein [Roseofilum sp. Guam]
MGTYYIGGTLPLNSKTYVTRAADEELYQQIQNGEFCYVLNARQMGKSSLRVRTMQRLQDNGVVCASIDITELGSQQVTPEKWYGGLVKTLVSRLGLEETFSLRSWFNERRDIPAVQFFGEFLEELIFRQITQPVAIFIDEIDSVLQLGFKDDFFALIRSCYNKRADDNAYKRLSFVLLGVATPGDLIEDKNRTPFNIGRAVELQGFQLHEVPPLVEGLKGRVSHPETAIEEILNWTGGQPFLTQKLCQWVCELAPNLPTGREGEWMENLVRTRIIENWEASDDPEHLKTIRNRILSNEQRAAYLLELYQQIRQQGQVVANNSFEEGKLQLSGLVVKQRTGTSVRLKVANHIYFEVFNKAWIEEQLEALRPYAEAFRDWVKSAGADESRLLRGKALQDAKCWAAGKNLSYRDQEFLAASEKKEIEVQIAQEKLEAELERERKDSEAAEQRNRVLTQANRKAKRRIRIGAVVMVMAILGATFSVQVAGNRVIKANREARQAQIQRQKAEEQVQNVSRLSELGGELRRENKHSEAEQAWKQAALSFEIKDYDLKQAMLLSHIATAYQQLEQLDKAMDAVSESLDFLNQVEDKQNLNYSILRAQALNIKSRLLVAQGDESVDFSVNQQAFDILQKLDPDLTGINPAVQVSFPETVENVYQGVLESIFDVEEVSQANLEKARQVVESLQLIKLHDFSQMFPLNPNLVKIEEIDPHAAVFYPILFEDRVEFILHLPSEPLYHYSIKRTIDMENYSRDIFRSLRSLKVFGDRGDIIIESYGDITIGEYGDITIGESRNLIDYYLKTSQKYNDLIFKPSEIYLNSSNIKTLVFISTQAVNNMLENLSVFNLHDGEQYLVEKYAVAFTPALEMIEAERQPQRPLRALVAGFSKDYKTDNILLLESPTTEQEIEKVSSIIPSSVLLNEKFTNTAFKKALENSYFPVVHLATISPLSIEIDNVIQTWDENISYEDFGKLVSSDNQGQDQGIDLLVLEHFISLVINAQSTKSTNQLKKYNIRTILTLKGDTSFVPPHNSIPDFMAKFYQEWTKPNVSKAEALRRAQVHFIKDPEFSYTNNMNWANYVLIGDWR